MSDLAHRVQLLEEGLSSASRVRLSVAQLGGFVAAVAAATWWVSAHMAGKDDLKVLEDKVTAAGATLKDVATTVAVLKDRSDRFEIPMVAEATMTSPAASTVPVAPPHAHHVVSVAPAAAAR